MFSTSIRLPKELNDRLTRLSLITGRSKSYYIHEAIRYHLEELERYYLAENEIIGNKMSKSKDLEKQNAENPSVDE